MKRKAPFQWTSETKATFEDLKRYLTSPPVMVAPFPREPLVLYLAANPHSASAALVVVHEEHVSAYKRQGDLRGIARRLPPEDVAPEALATSPTDKTPESLEHHADQGTAATSPLVEHPVYNTVLWDACTRYPMQQKLLIALLVTSRKLRHYFQGHPI